MRRATRLPLYDHGTNEPETGSWTIGHSGWLCQKYENANNFFFFFSYLFAEKISYSAELSMKKGLSKQCGPRSDVA